MPTDLPTRDWLLDRPEVLECLFHPHSGDSLGNRADLLDLRMPMADGTVIGGRCHQADPAATNVLFFHGNWLSDRAHPGPLIVMGRSLGSAPALELAGHHPEAIAGLILESGFAHTGPLLRRLGVNLTALRFEERQGFRQLDKMQTFAKPTLILHAEDDHLIPLADAQALYEASPARDKQWVTIPGADHNTIFAVGWPSYRAAIEAFAGHLQPGRDG